MFIMETFSDWLISVLNERGMSQSDLARAAGIGKGSLSDLLSGRRKVGSELATSIAKALKIPPVRVFQAAGLLPPDKTRHDAEVEQIIEELEDLSKDEQREVLSYIRWRSNNRKK